MEEGTNGWINKTKDKKHAKLTHGCVVAIGEGLVRALTHELPLFAIPGALDDLVVHLSQLLRHLKSQCLCAVTVPLSFSVITCNQNVFVLCLVLSVSSAEIWMFLCCYWSSLCCHVQSEYFCVVTGPLSVVTWNQNVSVLLLVLPLSSPAIRMFLCCYCLHV